MLNHFKKEDVIDYKIDYNKLTVFWELHSLMSNCKEFQTNELMFKLVPVIKKTLGDTFFVEYTYTFEELVSKIKNFDKECEKFFGRIEKLNKKKEDFLLKHKKKKKDKNFFSKLKSIDKEIQLEDKRYNSSRAISKILEDSGIKNKIFGFCNHLSTLEFSGQKISKEELTKIVFEFMCIVNQIYSYTNEKRAGQFKKAKYKINKIFGLSTKKNNTVQISGLPKLISKAETSIKNNNFVSAEQTYKKILEVYEQSPNILRRAAYGQLFNLWFNLYFYNYSNF